MFEEVLAALETRDEAISFEERRIPVDATSFSSITPEEGSACYVDGGNAALYKASHARIEYVRLCAARPDGKRIEEGVLLARRASEDIRVTGHGVELDVTLARDDAELRVGNDEVRLATAMNLARFILECRFAAHQRMLVVRDGLLRGLNRHEQEALDAIPTPVAGLAKTSTLATSDGGAAYAPLLGAAPEGAWRFPLGETAGVTTSVVRLHERARNPFRLDERGCDAAGILAAAASDPVFLGYPYPLIVADRLARVSNEEAALLRTRLQSEAGSSWESLAVLEQDAHAVLDSIGR